VAPDPACWHDPAPSHFPVFPHGVLALAAQVVVSRGLWLAAMLLQVPKLPEMAQLWQAPPQELLQQTPSVQ